MGAAIPAFTVIGASGFIGSRLVQRLRASGHAVQAPPRGDAGLFEQPLGEVIYCAGLTSDFRRRPHETVEAHVGLLNRLLERARFDSLLYLSSTRVYIRSYDTAETAPLAVAPLEPEDIFSLSKLTGESLCLHAGRGNVRIARLSNVLGDDFVSDNFVFALIRAAVESGHIELQTTLDSEKDYIDVDDVLDLLPRIALGGATPIYNLASGVNHTNAQIVSSICAAVPATFAMSAAARQIRFQPIDTARIKAEFGFAPRPVLSLVARLAGDFRAGRSAGADVAALRVPRN